MTQEDAHTVQDEAKPIPKRFWWLKRIGLGVLVLIVALAGLRWWWGRHADKILQAEIDRYRAAGQPVYPEDFVPARLADKDNAAIVLEQASAALARLSAKQTDRAVDLWSDPALIAKHSDEVARLIEASAEVRRLVRKARFMSRVHWGVPIQSSLRGGVFVDHRARRMLLRFLCLAATHAHQAGNDAEAVETLRDILGMAKHVDTRPTAIPHFVGTMIAHYGARWIEDIAPELRISDGAAVEGAAGNPATRDHVQTLIAALLDQEWSGWGFARTCYGERAIDIDTVEWLAGGTTGPVVGSGLLARAVDFALAPLFQLDVVRMMQDKTSWAEAAERSTWPPLGTPGIPTQVAHLGLHRIARSLSSIQISYKDFAISHLRTSVYLRMAAVALAIRMYQVDHHRRPERLDELVPKYLTSLPKDPFARNGRSIGYSPSAKPPVLYSVNLDGIDEQGAFELWPDGGIHRDANDYPFFLNGDRPRADPSTQTTQPTSSKTEEDQADVSDHKEDPAQNPPRNGQPQNR